MPRVVLNERIADYTKNRLLKIQSKTGMSRGQILDDVLWLADIIITNPNLFEDKASIMLTMDKILTAAKKKEESSNE